MWWQLRRTWRKEKVRGRIERRRKKMKGKRGREERKEGYALEDGGDVEERDDKEGKGGRAKGT